MCCLQYEQAAYEEMKKLMPKTGKEIQTPDGNGIAVENNAITEKTRVKLTLPDGTFDLRWYHYTELAKVGDPPPKAREKAPDEVEEPSANAAYVAPEGTPTAKKNRRRRKSGAKPEGARPENANPEAAQQPGGDQAGGQDGAQKKPRRRRKSGAKPEGARPENANPEAAQQPGGDQAGGQDDAQKKPRRRRRGGAGRNNHPHPEGQA